MTSLTKSRNHFCIQTQTPMLSQLLLVLFCLVHCFEVRSFVVHRSQCKIKHYKSNFRSKQNGIKRSSLTMSSVENFLPSIISKNAEVLWRFTRPHTIIGSGISVLSLFLYATPIQLWTTKRFWSNIVMAAVPSLFMNLYITGLNQVFDVQIDEVNKPYLPMASKELSKPAGVTIVLLSLILSYLTAATSQWPLMMTLIGSWFLGTIYSVPPFRLKRFPFLAAICILVVRGFLINIGFFLQAKIQVLGLSIPNILFGTKAFPESVFVSLFFVVYGIVIAFLKDVPDILGDKKFNIPSLSVQYGAKRIFR